MRSNVGSSIGRRGAVDYGECDYGGFYGECDYGECKTTANVSTADVCDYGECGYGGCFSVRVWPIG